MLSPRVHVVATIWAPAALNVSTSTGPVAPSLRVKVYLTVPGPFTDIYPENLTVTGQGPSFSALSALRNASVTSNARAPAGIDALIDADAARLTARKIETVTANILDFILSPIG